MVVRRVGGARQSTNTETTTANIMRKGIIKQWPQYLLPFILYDF